MSRGRVGKRIFFQVGTGRTKHLFPVPWTTMDSTSTEQFGISTIAQKLHVPHFNDVWELDTSKFLRPPKMTSLCRRQTNALEILLMFWILLPNTTFSRYAFKSEVADRVLTPMDTHGSIAETSQMELAEETANFSFECPDSEKLRCGKKGLGRSPVRKQWHRSLRVGRFAPHWGKFEVCQVSPRDLWPRMLLVGRSANINIRITKAGVY